MKGKSLKEWVDIYEQKTGEKARLPQNHILVYLPTRGFTSMKVDIEGSMLIVYQVCGDAKFWRDYTELRAVELGLNCVASILTRSIEPFIRDLEGEILEKEVLDGVYRYWCQDNIGRLAIITHKHTDPITGVPAYWITHYLNIKATSPMIEKMKKQFNLKPCEVNING